MDQSLRRTRKRQLMQTHELKRKTGSSKRFLLLSQAIGFLLCLLPGAADTRVEPPPVKQRMALTLPPVNGVGFSGYA